MAGFHATDLWRCLSIGVSLPAGVNGGGIESRPALLRGPLFRLSGARCSRKCMTTYRLERQQIIARPREEVFAFFSDASNLAKLTPEFLNFKIYTPAPIVMEPGTLIDYGLSLYGVPMRWRTRIEEFTPNERFIDVQLKGPYRLWHHTHTFEDHPEGTLMRDEVNYQLPFGPLGTLARALFVRRQLEQIFDYRIHVVESYFPSPDASLEIG